MHLYTYRVPLLNTLIRLCGALLDEQRTFLHVHVGMKELFTLTEY